MTCLQVGCSCRRAEEQEEIEVGRGLVRNNTPATASNSMSERSADAISSSGGGSIARQQGHSQHALKPRSDVPA